MVENPSTQVQEIMTRGGSRDSLGLSFQFDFDPEFSLKAEVEEEEEEETVVSAETAD